MIEFFESIIKNIKNRLGTPFLSATLFSYIVIHWKVFYVLVQRKMEFSYKKIR